MHRLFRPGKTAKRPKDEISAVVASCAAFMEELLENEGVLTHAGLQVETRSIRRLGGTISVSDTPFAQSPERIGVSLVVNATDIDQAVDIAAMHPAIQVEAGEDLGWGAKFAQSIPFRVPYLESPTGGVSRRFHDGQLCIESSQNFPGLWGTWLAV